MSIKNILKDLNECNISDISCGYIESGKTEFIPLRFKDSNLFLAIYDKEYVALLKYDKESDSFTIVKETTDSNYIDTRQVELLVYSNLYTNQEYPDINQYAYNGELKSNNIAREIMEAQNAFGDVYIPWQDIIARRIEDDLIEVLIPSSKEIYTYRLEWEV